MPTLTWQHNGKIVMDNQPDYLATIANNGTMIVESDLRIFSVGVDKTGEVTCIVNGEPPADSDVTLIGQNATASLTVIGE